TWKLEADKLLLPLLHRLVNGVIIAAERASEGPRLADVTRGEKQARQDQLLDGVCVRARRVEHWDAALAEICDGNVVHTGTGTAHGTHGGRNGRAVHVGRADENGIRLIDVSSNFVAIPRQTLQAAGTDVVQGQDSVAHGHGVPASSAVTALKVLHECSERL